MQSVPREWLDFLRQQFPKDSRIQLTEIGGNPRPFPPAVPGNWIISTMPGNSM